MSVSSINQDTEAQSAFRPPGQDDLAWVRETFEQEWAYSARRSSSSRLRRRVVLTIVAVASVAGLVSLFLPRTARTDAVISRHSKTMVELKAPEMDVAGLILDWRNLWDQTVIVKGDVRCENDNCWFVPPQHLDQNVAIDIFMLPLESRRHVVLDCQVSQCPMLVTGSVPYGNGMFMADKISDDSR